MDRKKVLDDGKVPILPYTRYTGHKESWLASGNIRLPELMNAIWENYPEYAISFNAHEQAGLNDCAGMLLQLVGMDVELNGSEKI